MEQAGYINLWEGDNSWVLCWEVTGKEPNQWLAFYAGPPAGNRKHAVCDPQISGYWTAGRCEVETVGHITFDGAACALLRKVLDAVRLKAAEVF